MANRSSPTMSRQEAGRRGAEARWGRQSCDQPQNRSSQNRPGSHLQHQEAGRGGAAARWGRSSDDRAVQGQYSQRENQRRVSQGQYHQRPSQGPMSRQEVGQRGGRALLEEYGPEFYREIGRRGAHARWEDHDDMERQYHPRSQHSGYFLQEEEMEPGAYWDRDYDEEDLYDENYENEDEDEDDEEPHLHQRGGSHVQYQRARSYDRDEDFQQNDSRYAPQVASRQVAGRRGGEVTSSRYGHGFYQDIGRRGGQASRGSRQY